MDTVVFTILKNTNGTYKVFCKNGFRSHNKDNVKDLFKVMSELSDFICNSTKMGVLFEVDD